MLQFEGLVRALGPSLAAARAVLSSSEQGAPHGAKTCADLRVRALVLRYLCAVRPWLLSEREGTPSRMQEASVVRWLTKGSRDRSQKVVLSTLSELIESAGRALAGLGAGGAGGAGGGDDDDVSYLDLGGEDGSEHVLSDAEINNTIRQSFGGIRQCILAEFKRDPGFKGVTVQFFIKPSGSTGGVKVAGGSGPVVECLTTRFRGMRFPQHSGLNKGVTYPLRLQ